MAAKAEMGNQMPMILPGRLCAPLASQKAMHTSQLARIDLTTTCSHQHPDMNFQQPQVCSNKWHPFACFADEITYAFRPDTCQSLQPHYVGSCTIVADLTSHDTYFTRFLGRDRAICISLATAYSCSHLAQTQHTARIQEQINKCLSCDGTNPKVAGI